MLARVAWALVVFSFCGCGTTIRYAATNPPPRAMTPRDPSTVGMFQTGVPDRPYTEVGILSARQSSQYSVSDLQDIVDAMRKRAAQIGCDAVVITGSDKEVVGSSTTSQGTGSGSVHTLEGIKGVCIVYESADVTTAAAAPPPAEAPKLEPTASEAPAPGPKPDGAAGLIFGQPLDEVQSACTSAKLKWAKIKGARYSCSGTPKSVGMPAVLALRFCDNRLCEINVEPQSSDAQETFRTIQSALVRKYGKAKKTTENVPGDCASDQLATCLADSRATLNSEWWWDSGERIIESVERAESTGGVLVRITYSKWPLDPPQPASGDGL